jgi:hypothetical protein
MRVTDYIGWRLPFRVALPMHTALTLGHMGAALPLAQVRGCGSRRPGQWCHLRRLRRPGGLQRRPSAVVRLALGRQLRSSRLRGCGRDERNRLRPLSRGLAAVLLPLSGLPCLHLPSPTQHCRSAPLPCLHLPSPTQLCRSALLPCWPCLHLACRPAGHPPPNLMGSCSCTAGWMPASGAWCT